MQWFARFLEGLFLLFAGTLVIYLIRHFLPWGCAIGMALCLIGLYIVGRIQQGRKRKAGEPVVTGATGAIGEAVRLSTARAGLDIQAKGVVGKPGVWGATGPRMSGNAPEEEK
ncbi:MAG: hypothetical protein WA614_11465 [Acidimicrobiales bacterium]